MVLSKVEFLCKRQTLTPKTFLGESKFTLHERANLETRRGSKDLHSQTNSTLGQEIVRSTFHNTGQINKTNSECIYNGFLTRCQQSRPINKRGRGRVRGALHVQCVGPVTELGVAFNCLPSTGRKSADAVMCRCNAPRSRDLS